MCPIAGNEAATCLQLPQTVLCVAAGVREMCKFISFQKFSPLKTKHFRYRAAGRTDDVVSTQQEFPTTGGKHAKGAQ